jgi:hypothetical protein
MIHSRLRLSAEYGRNYRLNNNRLNAGESPHPASDADTTPLLPAESIHFFNSRARHPIECTHQHRVRIILLVTWKRLAETWALIGNHKSGV